MCADVVAQNQGCSSFTQHILRENNFVCVRYWINELTGRHIDEFERFTIQSRLAPCAERSGFANVNHYVEFLGSQTADFSLPCWQELMDAVLETETWFRREAKHFNFLKQILLPVIPDDAILLSAGCGDGEEAFDMAFECADYFGINAGWQVDAFDIRTEAIRSAKLAYWNNVDCASLPDKFLDSYFEKQESEKQESEKQESEKQLFHKHKLGIQKQGLNVIPEIREKVTFICQNLLEVHIANRYCVIFCRNLLMDMEKTIARRVVSKLMDALTPDGVLIVSYTETLEEFVQPNALISPTIARKI